jgi:hypothetical protein
VREVRSIYPSLPIVIASGKADAELRELFKGLEAITFVSKPYTADELKMSMRSIGLRC